MDENADCAMEQSRILRNALKMDLSGKIKHGSMISLMSQGCRMLSMIIRNFNSHYVCC